VQQAVSDKQFFSTMASVMRHLAELHRHIRVDGGIKQQMANHRTSSAIHKLTTLTCTIQTDLFPICTVLRKPWQYLSNNQYKMLSMHLHSLPLSLPARLQQDAKRMTHVVKIKGYAAWKLPVSCSASNSKRPSTCLPSFT
jgi:hypothetical protein